MRRRRSLEEVTQLKASQVKDVRAVILNEQNGRCWICGCIPKIPCLDHEHKKRRGGSGKIRGVLCNNCNSFLAKSENNCVRYTISKEELPDTLRKMADYLEKKQYPMLHPSEVEKPKKLKKASYNKMYAWHKKNNTEARVAAYPKSGTLIKPLQRMFEMAGVEPEFYK